MAIQTADFYLYASPISHYCMVSLLSPRIFLLLNHTHLKNSLFQFGTRFSSGILWDPSFAFWIKNERTAIFSIIIIHMICQRLNVPVRDAMTTNYGILELVGTGKLLSNESFTFIYISLWICDYDSKFSATYIYNFSGCFVIFVKCQ